MERGFFKWKGKKTLLQKYVVEPAILPVQHAGILGEGHTNAEASAAARQKSATDFENIFAVQFSSLLLVVLISRKEIWGLDIWIRWMSWADDGFCRCFLPFTVPGLSTERLIWLTAENGDHTRTILKILAGCRALGLFLEALGRIKRSPIRCRALGLFLEGWGRIKWVLRSRVQNQRIW